MSLVPGTRLGPYEVVALIGAGGMGEVYRARDTKLNRDVALKGLPDLFANDPERLARFQREAQVLAALNHPNIAHIHGLEESNGIRALVMELVEGPTLADRIAHGPISVAETLPIAKQIADALEAAHELGVTHRDLKPANIKVREDGMVKVLDFGLAKLAAPEASGARAMALSQAPTLTTPAATLAGAILGTAAYMAPEQARGKAVDKRVDIWAFGVVLFEMLTGQRLFTGEEISDTLAAVLKTEPNWKALPSTTPLGLRRLLRRCLDKDPKRRLQAIGEARVQIEDLLGGAPEEAGPPAISRALPLWQRGLPWAVASVLLVGLGLLSSIHFRETPPPNAPEMRTEIVTPASTDPTSFALSPDGRHIVFVASSDGPSRLWLRPLVATAAQPLLGTEGATYPFWSPDSKSVGFFADGKLKRLDLGGGLPQALANAAPRGGAWNADGVILFARTTGSPLFRVSASGGEAVAVTKLDRQTSHRFPQFLPDGRRFLFYAQGPPETAGIYLDSLDSGAPKRLTAADTAGAYAPSGWLLWVRAGTLVAQRLDLERRELTGNPVTVADPVGFEGAVYAGAFSISAAGLVAYRPGGASRRQLRWFDREGKMLGAMGAPDEAALLYPSVSPDGRRVAVSRTVQGNTDIWLVDGTRTSRFTFDAALDSFPLWSPDGGRIVFRSNRKGTYNLYVRPTNGASTEELLVESSQDKTPQDWSADGRFVFYLSLDPQTDYDLWVLPLDGDRKPSVFLKTNFSERQGQFSRDERWAAYMSNESGRPEIYVRPFVAPAASPADDRATASRAGGQWQVSTAGGIYPRWRPDGKELYYIGPDGQMMAAPITATGTTLEPGTPMALFQTRIFGGGADTQQGRQYDVARDGRFLINTALDDAAAPITLLQNWTAGLKK